MLADLFWIIVETGADDTETIRCQYPAMHLIGLVLLVLLIFLIQYLLHGNLSLFPLPLPDMPPYRDHREFYTTLYNAGLSSIMMETILSTIKITPDMQNLEAYMKSFWAYGIYGWLLEWIKRGMPESGNELLTLFSLTRQN